MSISHNHFMHIFDSSSLIESSSTALLLSSFSSLSEALFTNFSLEPTWRWYFTMTPFETIFLGLIILQFSVLNMFGIMPLNLSELLNGMPAGRRKRDAPELQLSKRSLGYQMMKLLKKLDPDECTFRSLCEVERYSCSGDKSIDIPVGIKWVLSNLREKQSAQKYKMKDVSSNPSNVWDESTKPNQMENDDSVILKLYEEAVILGGQGSSIDVVRQPSSPSTFPVGNFTTTCELRYPRCPLGSKDILDFVTQIHILDEF